jgi:predicted helicase
MRKAPGKKYGYIIIPVVVRADVKPEEALDNNPNFKVVWTVLNALRAHDEEFNAIINRIELNKNQNNNGSIIIGGIPSCENDNREGFESRTDSFPENAVKQLTMKFGELQSVIYARMVQKVGNRKYWEQWAKDIAQIAQTLS